MSNPTTDPIAAYSVYVALGVLGVIVVAALVTKTPLDSLQSILETLIGFIGIRQGIKSIFNK